MECPLSEAEPDAGGERQQEETNVSQEFAIINSRPRESVDDVIVAEITKIYEVF